MKKSILIEPGDIKKMLAERFHVPESSVLKIQYSYTVILEDEKEKTNHEDDN